MGVETCDNRSVFFTTPKTKSTRPSLPSRSGQGEALRQNLRIKVTYDEAKIDRLIEFERSELKRMGESETMLEDPHGKSNCAIGTGQSLE